MFRESSSKVIMHRVADGAVLVLDQATAMVFETPLWTDKKHLYAEIRPGHYGKLQHRNIIEARGYMWRSYVCPLDPHLKDMILEIDPDARVLLKEGKLQCDSSSTPRKFETTSSTQDVELSVRPFLNKQPSRGL